jgi:apolipoprotein N-acyltransferase
VAVGPLICYEDVFPSLALDSVRAGADVLAVLTNNAWYGEGGAAYQHAAHSVLRAIETRRPVLRCGNGGWSGWIDEFGSIRDTLTNAEGSIYTAGHAHIDVTRDARWIGRQSFYVQYGDWFLVVCVVLATLGFAIVSFGKPMKLAAWARRQSSAALKAWACVMAFSVRLRQSRMSSPKKRKPTLPATLMCCSPFSSTR